MATYHQNIQYTFLIIPSIHTVPEKAMAPHSSTLAWKIPWTEEPGGLQSMGSLGVGHDWQLHFNFSLPCIGEKNGNPLQCSCLENPRDNRAWWAAIYGVAQSQTRLKRLSSSSIHIVQHKHSTVITTKTEELKNLLTVFWTYHFCLHSLWSESELLLCLRRIFSELEKNLGVYSHGMVPVCQGKKIKMQLSWFIMF